jgi:hypothetical protein
MSLAPVASPFPSLSDVLDAVASRTGAWILVERFGAVLAHGTGTGPCPPPVAEAVICKSTAALRARVLWARGPQRLGGTVDGHAVRAVNLGDGATSWFVGGRLEEDSLPLLAAAVSHDARPIEDAFVDELLHPRDSARGHDDPPAVLAVLTSREPVAATARAALTAVAGSTARVHSEPDVVVVALPPDGDVRALTAAVCERCPDIVAGASVVPDDVAEWPTAARLARGAARAARRLGLQVGFASAPAVAAELVIVEAQDAVAALTSKLGRTPMDRLAEYDARTSSELLSTVRAWCDAGCDVAVAASRLYVHTNTLRYRLRRASQISGLDLNEPRHVLAVKLLLG